MTRRAFDILRYERRGDDYALVRIAADGSRSEIILTAANIVHLGMVTADFSRRLLANKVATKAGSLGARVKHGVLSTNVRTIELLMRILERGGHRPGFVITEQRARQLATRLLAQADELASMPRAGASRAPQRRRRTREERV